MGSRTQAIGFDDAEFVWPEVTALRRAIEDLSTCCRAHTARETTSELTSAFGEGRGLVVWLVDRKGAAGEVHGFMPYYRTESRVELTVVQVSHEQGPADTTLTATIGHTGVLVTGALSNPIFGFANELSSGAKLTARVTALACEVVSPHARGADPVAARPGESARLEAGPWKTLVCGPPRAGWCGTWCLIADAWSSPSRSRRRMPRSLSSKDCTSRRGSGSRSRSDEELRIRVT